ncbi:dual specificity protein phosphatase 1-like [Momordica charantia]|uniref:Dual specificity protein phosphatase 1-like n=1 Tax=Momordica charantia TaxID=3673 RepID=A0A6J1CCW2_MOMCH|nr:dual specificity protein phosphatase 1-like [Momordica charantia]XP_022138399.1 dual specificity protein phosphatase 1-like [Momordica charantia]
MEMDSADMRVRLSALWNIIGLKRGLKEDRIPCQIEEGLYLGSVGAAHNKDQLKKLNITHILTIACSLPPADPNDFVYKVVGVLDTRDADIKRHFEDCFNFIDEARKSGGGVLVHCFAGISRSVTITVAYLMKKRGMNLAQALEHVKSRRPKAAPNVGFMVQLKDFEMALQASKEEQKLSNV